MSSAQHWACVELPARLSHNAPFRCSLACVQLCLLSRSTHIAFPPAPLLPPQVLERHSNGFVVAECDLELRGSGELLGTRQSGRGLRTSFKVGGEWRNEGSVMRARSALLRPIVLHR